MLIPALALIVGLGCLDVAQELEKFYCIHYFLPLNFHIFIFPFMKNLPPLAWAFFSTLVNFFIGFAFGWSVEIVMEVLKTDKEKR